MLWRKELPRARKELLRCWQARIGAPAPFLQAPPRTASTLPGRRRCYWLAAQNPQFGENGSSVRMRWKLHLQPCETAVSQGFRITGLRRGHRGGATAATSRVPQVSYVCQKM